MWGDSKKQKTGKVDTLIGSNTELHGDVMFSGGLHIDGRIKGNVIAGSQGGAATLLVLSDKGSIEGEVRVPFMIINGLVVGNLYAAESVELSQNARITGNVYYNRIEIALGAEVNGSLVHQEDLSKGASSGKSPAGGGK
ncbi:MAG: polymer-forming cytoskeletal protein [Gammaproteobacteria bacterium]|nr:polymer-forming cytoskeletal protein [Gammaproteobacteria bacterium]